jgi:hypothetical protein
MIGVTKFQIRRLKTFTLSVGLAAPDQTVPSGTDLSRDAFPGTSCLATISLSLRDKNHSTAEALLESALMGKEGCAARDPSRHSGQAFIYDFTGQDRNPRFRVSTFVIFELFCVSFPGDSSLHQFTDRLALALHEFSKGFYRG